MCRLQQSSQMQQLGHSQGFYKLLHADSFACSELTYAISEYIRSTADSYNNITSVFVPVYRLLQLLEDKKIFYNYTDASASRSSVMLRSRVMAVVLL